MISETSLSVYRTLETIEQRNDFRQALESKGYYAFYAFIEDFRLLLKSYQDEDISSVGQWLRNAQEDFPNPQQLSPSWSSLWEEFTLIYNAKNEVLADVPATNRDGEWQVLIDNPYLPHQVVCYPGLSFIDAAYMFAYFQKDLKPNEILRLQHVSLSRIKTGDKKATMLPDT